MKRITVLILGVALLGAGWAYAQQVPLTAQPTVQSTAQQVIVGNKHCPVSGEEVAKMGPPVTYEYNGKVYNLCCPGCLNAFKKNPEKYSKIAEQDAKITK